MKNEEFTKLSKSQKLEIEPISFNSEVADIKKVLFIPTKRKNDGYTVSAFFVMTTSGKWFRLQDYDCFRFTNCDDWLRGDFENDGVQFFLGDKGSWTASYGGDFTFNPLIN
jgi:hypothetical protein